MTEPPYYPSSHHLDTSAPFQLIETTVAVREAFAEPAPEYHELGGACREASHLLALILKRVGWDAMCMPASWLGDGHFVVLANEWMLDPTAEQFGVGGPFVCPVMDLPNSDFELELFVEDAFEPSEQRLIRLLAKYDASEATAVLAALDFRHLDHAVLDAAAARAEG